MGQVNPFAGQEWRRRHKNGYVDTRCGEGEGGMNWEIRIDIYTLLPLLLLSRFSRVRLCATYPIDGSPPGSPVPGILQARTLEWAAISFSHA